MDEEQVVNAFVRWMGNKQHAKPGPYTTQLEPDQEAEFLKWVKDNKVPFDPQEPFSDYDMRGYYKAQQAGDASAKQAENLHFPDTYKTPYHETFSNESQYALPTAPHWEENTLKDQKGNVLFTEPAE